MAATNVDTVLSSEPKSSPSPPISPVTLHSPVAEIEEKTPAPTVHDEPIDERKDDLKTTRPPTIDINLEAPPGVIEDPEDAFPEGGRGWVVVFGSMLLTASTFGLVNSWGVFQAHYQDVILPSTNPSTLAWIGSVQYALVFLPGLLAGRLFDIGYFRPMLLVASCLLVVATFLVAQCREFWQFMLAQGIATGIACGFVFGGAIPVVSHWFKRRRNTAFGIIATGSSYGGTVFPIITRNLIPVVGFPWTMRILAFILLGQLALANLLVRRRLPPVKVAGGLFNLAAFNSAPYSIYVACVAIGFLGMYTCLTFLDVSAVVVGVSPDFSFYLVSIANAGSGVGRIVSGLLSDRLGPMNVLIPFSLLAGVFTLVWPWCTSKPSLIAIALLYGFASGAFVGLLPSPVAQLGGTGDIGRRTGMLFTVLACGAVAGPPISGAIYARYGEFRQVGVYAGCVIFVATGLMGVARWKALGGLWGRF
ncbi:hypothetical protein FRB99_006752 [Tulasnella sp. 403]|nr:hypothetical protein FRB99_006752 [Tulasnella sp. 403]